MAYRYMQFHFWLQQLGLCSGFSLSPQGRFNSGNWCYEDRLTELHRGTSPQLPTVDMCPTIHPMSASWNFFYVPIHYQHFPTNNCTQIFVSKYKLRQRNVQRPGKLRHGLYFSGHWNIFYKILKDKDQDGSDNPIWKTEKETQMYRTDF